MEKIKHQIKPLSVVDKRTLFEYLRDLLKLKTVSNYARQYSRSYNGIDKGKDNTILTTEIDGKKFVIDEHDN
jgi:hypothetical protein